MSHQPTVAIIGASRNRRKYGNISVRAHAAQGYEVYPVNPFAPSIEGHDAFASLSELPVDSVDRISVYLPPEDGIELLVEIRDMDASEVWFNPGSVDGDLRRRARELGLEIIEGCSIVDLGVSPAEFM